MAANSNDPNNVKTLKSVNGLNEASNPSTNDTATLNMKGGSTQGTSANQLKTLTNINAAGSNDANSNPAQNNKDENVPDSFADVKYRHLIGREYTLNNTNYKITGVIAFETTGEANIFRVEDQNGHSLVLKMYKSNILVKSNILDTVKSIDHPHVVELHDYGTSDEGVFYELMEEAEGGISFTRSPITNTDDLKKIIMQTASALEYCHTRKLVHRDIKPENLLLKNKDDIHVLIADFGISSLMKQNENHHATAQGFTYQYAAPEVLSYSTGKILVGPAVDYYGLGLTLITLFKGESWAKDLAPAVITNMINQSRVPIPEDMPDDIKHAVQGLLIHKEAQRWGYEELQKWAAGEDVPIPQTVLQGTVNSTPPFEFMKQKGKILKAHDPDELAELIFEYKDQGIKRLYRHDIGDWIQPQIPIMESQLDDIIESYPRDEGKENDGILAAYYLLSSKKYFVDKDWKRHDLSGCASKEDMLDTVGDLIDKPDKAIDYLDSECLKTFMMYNDLDDAYRDIEKEILIPFRNKVFTPLKAANKLILKLQKGDTFRTYGTDYNSFSELNDAPAYVKNDLAKDIHDNNSKFLCWLEEMYLKSDSLDISRCDTTELVTLIHKMPWLREYDAQLNDRLNKKNASGFTDLMELAQAGELELCKNLVSSGADIHYKDNDGNTAFTVAAKAQEIEVMEYLFSLKADINPALQNDSSFIHILARENLPKSIQFLIDHGVDADFKRQKDNWTPLFEAVSYGSRDAITTLLKAGANPTPLDNNKQTPLHTLIAHDDLNLLEFMLQNGSNPNSCEKTNSPLHYATHRNKAQALELLLKYGADPNIGKQKRDTALPVAVEKNYINIVKILLKAGADPGVGIHNFPKDKSKETGNLPALFQAIIKKNWDCAKLLVKNKAPLNFTYKDGHGYLSYLYHNKDGSETEVMELMELMLKKGLNPNHNDEDRKLLFTAIDTDNYPLMELLLKHGMNPDIQTDDNHTPIIQAVFKGASHVKYAETLLKYKANPHITVQYDQDTQLSAFSYAAKYLDSGYVNLFLLNGADPLKSAKYDPLGYTPLHHAIIGTKKENIKLLSTKKSWRNAKSTHGNTPFALAGWMRDQWTCEYLVHMGINYKTKNKDDQDAFELAATRPYPIDDYMRQLCGGYSRQQSKRTRRKTSLFSRLKSFEWHKPIAALIRITAFLLLGYALMYAARNGYYLEEYYPIESFYNAIFAGDILLHILAVIGFGWLMYWLPINGDAFYDDKNWFFRSLISIPKYGWILFIPELLILPEFIGIPTTSWMAPLYATGWQQHIWGALHAESIIPFLTFLDGWPVIGDWLARPQMTVIHMLAFIPFFIVSKIIYEKFE